MLGIKIFNIADNERGLLFERHSFAGVLEPGRHVYVDLLGRIQVDRYDVTEPELRHRLARFLANTYPVLTERYVDSVELNDNQVGLCFVDGKLRQVIEPGAFRLFWKGPSSVAVKVLGISEVFAVPRDILAIVGHARKAQEMGIGPDSVYYTEVENNHVGLLYVDGKLSEILPPGGHGYWRFNRSIVIKHLDCRLQTMEVSGQEILTKDRVSLRLNLSGGYRIVDPEKVATQVADYAGHLYRELQLELREAVGTRTLDELLADKDALNRIIAGNIREKAEAFGIRMEDVGVKDIILPGEMKLILNQVVLAEKTAEANLIRRREETAATRSLHNTAKVMEGNPTLLRLKELEVLEKITERIDKITVYGGLDGVLKDLVKIPFEAKS